MINLKVLQIIIYIMAGSSQVEFISEDSFSPPVAKKSRLDVNAKSKRWMWEDHMIEDLIKNLFAYKTSKVFEGYDFEADLITLYGDIRKEMAESYRDFGPMTV